VRRRERRRARQVEQRCAEIIEESIAHYESLLPAAGDTEREVYGRRVRQLTELLAYVGPRT